MADFRISELPDGGTVGSTDTFPAVRAGVTYRMLPQTAGGGAISLIDWADLPAASSDGLTYIFNNSPYMARDNGTGYDYFFNGFKAHLFDETGFTWDTQGPATFASVNGLGLLTLPETAERVRMLYETIPFAAWELTVLLRQTYFATDATQQVGIAMRDGTGKIYTFYVGSDSTLRADQWTDSLTFSGVGAVDRPWLSAGMWHWLRIERYIGESNDNLDFFVSVDGVNFTEVGSEVSTAFFVSGPTQVGIFGNSDSALFPFSGTFASYQLVEEEEV